MHIIAFGEVMLAGLVTNLCFPTTFNITKIQHVEYFQTTDTDNKMQLFITVNTPQKHQSVLSACIVNPAN
jgi:hypothetical protein